MNKILALLVLSLSLTGFAADPGNQAAAPANPINTECIISGKAADPGIISTYEGTTYAFFDEACRTQFEADRAGSIYQQLGGKDVIHAAVELFSTKVLADDRLKDFFADSSMRREKRKQREFFSMALGAPTKYTGADLRTAHAGLHGLNDTHFDAVAGHLQATLVELKVDKALVARIMAIVEGTRDDVLNRGRPGKEHGTATSAN